MQEPLLSIAIMKGLEIEFELHGDFVCTEFKCTCNGKFKASLEDKEIVIVGESGSKKSLEQVTFTPEEFDTESFLLKGVTIGIDFHWEQKENQRFIGSLKFLIEDNLINVRFNIRQIIPVFVLPSTLYLKADKEWKLRFLIKLENIINKVMPSNWVARSFIVVAEKI